MQTCEGELKAADVDGLGHVADIHAGHLSGGFLEQISGWSQHQLGQKELLRLGDRGQEPWTQVNV